VLCEFEVEAFDSTCCGIVLNYKRALVFVGGTFVMFSRVFNSVWVVDVLGCFSYFYCKLDCSMVRDHWLVL